MHIYVATDATDPGEAVHFCTLNDAHVHVREIFEPIWRAGVRIHLIDIKTDKVDVVWLLNNPKWSLKLIANDEDLRTWKVTERGGLKELAKTTAEPEEDPS